MSSVNMFKIFTFTTVIVLLVSVLSCSNNLDTAQIDSSNPKNANPVSLGATKSDSVQPISTKPSLNKTKTPASHKEPIKSTNKKNRNKTKALPTQTPTPVFSALTAPLIDAHLHLPSSIEPEVLFKQLSDAGISKVMVFGKFEKLLPLKQQNRSFVSIFPQVRRDPITKELLLNSKMVNILEKQLDTGIPDGIGEISFRHQSFINSPVNGDQNPVDGPEAMQFFKLAGEQNSPIIVHIEREFSNELESALQQNPTTDVIWAHMGDASAAVVGAMLENNPNLYADISCRNPLFPRGFSMEEQSLTHENGILKEDWRLLFEKFPDRFMFGTDIGTGNRHEMIYEIVTYYRSVLGQLTPTTAESIASKNAKSFLE